MINYKGKSIVILDLSRCPPEETMKVLPVAQTLIMKFPSKSALVLTDVTDATYNKEVASAIKDFVIKYTPYIKASAVVGADGVRNVLLQTVIMVTRREMKSFDERDKAKEWLASH
jgi:hypothetical protein